MATTSAALTITSPRFPVPLSIPIPAEKIALPVAGELKIVAASPAGTLTESVAITLAIDGIVFLENVSVAKFPIDLPASLGFLASAIEAIDASITLDVVAS